MSVAATIREIRPGESIRPFIDVAWTINSRDPAWVPPLRAPLRALLDRKRHPFHRHAEVAYFIAERGGMPVGRIAAIVNHRHNEFHQDRTGFFGFFECEHDPETGAALLRTAEEWLLARGMNQVLGPMSFSTNEECGLLVEGFGAPPAFMMPYNPRHYDTVLQLAGYRRAKDLLAFGLDYAPPPERLVRGVDLVARRAKATVRSFDKKHFDRDLGIIKGIYNSAWERNWGFVPMTDEEFEFMAKEMRPVMDPELVLIAEVDGVPAGFSLALPDLNIAFKPLNGRLFPFGFFRFLWRRRKISRIRVLTLGLRPEFKHLGLGPLLYLRTWMVGSGKGYRHGEASWILEDNLDMVRALEKMGAYVDKRYRIYERALENGARRPE